VAGTQVADGIINPPIDELLEVVDSKYRLVIMAAKRARQINAYYSQLGEGLLEYVGPLVETRSQIGSGALPVSLLPSTALALRAKTGSGTAVEVLSHALRKLPIPVIGRIEGGCALLDLRCLEDEAAFLAQLPALAASKP